MSRTVLVKPLASMLRIYPDVYEPGVTCEEVLPHLLFHAGLPSHGRCFAGGEHGLRCGSTPRSVSSRHLQCARVHACCGREMLASGLNRTNTWVSGQALTWPHAQ